MHRKRPEKISSNSVCLWRKEMGDRIFLNITISKSYIILLL